MKRFGLILGFLLVSLGVFGQSINLSEKFVSVLKSRKATLTHVKKHVDLFPVTSKYESIYMVQVDPISKTTTLFGISNDIKAVEIEVLFKNRYFTPCTNCGDCEECNDEPRTIQYFIKPLNNGYFYYWFQSDYYNEVIAKSK